MTRLFSSTDFSPPLPSQMPLRSWSAGARPMMNTGHPPVYAVRRRGHSLSFDAAVYRRWTHGGGVWPGGDEGEDRGQGRDGGPDVCTFATCFGHLCTTCRKHKTAQNNAGSTNSCTYREKRLSLSTNLHQNTHTVSGTCSGVSESLTLCVCENRNGANDSAIQPVLA